MVAIGVGGGDAIDVMTGQVSMYISEIPSALALVRDGKLKALGVGSTTRDNEMAELPTIAETLPGFEAVGWQGLFARSGTPKDVVEKLNRVLLASLKRPDTAGRFNAIGVGAKLATPEESRAFVSAQLRLFKKVVADAGIVPE